jgi:hypothetical protein
MLEPELEALAGEWSPEMRRLVARKFRRWVRELELSAKIIASDAGTPRRPSLPRVPPGKSALN